MVRTVSRSLDFSVVGWLPGSGLTELERATLASLSIVAGADRGILTEVEDLSARTVRGHINVPAYPIARWLLVNFWRLRWEPWRGEPASDWLESHSMAAIDGAHAWPALDFASDGDFVQLRLRAEGKADVAAIRYLREVNLEIPVLDFERAVFAFIDTVEGRVAGTLPGQKELIELREELVLEREDPKVAAACRLQAIAGIDPGAASPEWFGSVASIASEAGPTATDELLAVLPMIPEGLGGLETTVAAMRGAPTSIRLDWVPAAGTHGSEPAWSRGEELAKSVRAHLSLDGGPLLNARLGALLDVQLPLQRNVSSASPRLSGAYRGASRATMLVPTANPQSQRFYLARLIAAASELQSQRVLPVSKTATALQKFERAFAAEFLCPWRDLDAFTDECGTDDDAIAEAAAHFDVSEMLVLSSLVNKGKVHRARLA